MKHKINVYLLLLIPFFASNTVTAETFIEAFKNGSIEANLRYRYESVDQNNALENAKASTIRTRLGYRTGDYNGFTFYAELDDVRKIGFDNYTTPNGGPLATSVGPKFTEHSIIADPLATKLNQLTISYKNENSKLTIGRQRIIRGNSRFIGNVGWRQHEQTYDGVSFSNESIDNLSLFAAYIENRNTITFTEIEQDTFLLDAKYTGFKEADLTMYYYDINVGNSPAKWENIGVRYSAKYKKLSYTLEYAQQSTATAAKPDYLFLEGSYKLDIASLSIGYESLGSDNNVGFTTPLATLHKFNGWADQFLATPNVGLVDKYIKASRKLESVNVAAIFHQYDSDINDVDLGDELNLVITKKVSDTYSIGAKYADYSAGDVWVAKVDAEKFWFWGEAKF